MPICGYFSPVKRFSRACQRVNLPSAQILALCDAVGRAFSAAVIGRLAERLAANLQKLRIVGAFANLWAQSFVLFKNFDCSSG